jgi:hypothetical protein
MNVTGLAAFMEHFEQPNSKLVQDLEYDNHFFFKASAQAQKAANRYLIEIN